MQSNAEGASDDPGLCRGVFDWAVQLLQRQKYHRLTPNACRAVTSGTGRPFRGQSQTVLRSGALQQLCTGRVSPKRAPAQDRPGSPAFPARTGSRAAPHQGGGSDRSPWRSSAAFSAETTAFGRSGALTALRGCNEGGQSPREELRSHLENAATAQQYRLLEEGSGRRAGGE